MIYRRFLVRENDHFSPYQFQQVELEIEGISAELEHFPGDGKAEMLISWCKNGKVETEHALINPELTKRVETLPVSSIKELFACCANNITFMRELEEHLKESLNVTLNHKSKILNFKF